MKKYFLSFIILFLPVVASFAQQDDAEYTKVLTQRAEKIVETLGITDQNVYQRVTNVIVEQYKGLGIIHDTHDAQVKDAKSKAGNDKAAAETAVNALQNETNAKLYDLHCAYIGSLSAELTNEQIDQVKDGMTYGVVQVTYRSYQDMIPSLKEEEKRQLLAWLIEAREHAMDASSSKKKHEWFGKYKGRYNNYLSKQGYDIQKERKAWEERVKAAGGTL